MNGAVPTTIIVAGLALAGYALVMTARNRRMDVPLLAAVGVLEILLLVEVGIIVATFPDATVWSGYGSGYGFVPLVLPVFGLLWLRRRARRPGQDADDTGTDDNT